LVGNPGQADAFEDYLGKDEAGGKDNPPLIVRRPDTDDEDDNQNQIK
jgi:hypothetical protein